MNQILFSQRFALIFFTIICIAFINSNSQTLPPYLQKIDYIPVIAHTNLSAGQLANPSLSLQRMKELGIYGVIATDLTSAAYSSFINDSLKVIPNQLWVTDNYVNYYTDGVYTIWEAEGKGDGSMGETEIYHNNNIGEFFSDSNSINGIRTVSNAPAATLIYGPWYSQRVKYKLINDTEIINYTADYLMKITSIGSRPPNGYKDSIVCTLEITVSDTLGTNDSVIVSKNVTVRELLQDTTYWDSWDTVKIERFNFSGLKDLDIKSSPEESIGAKYTTEYVQYKIQWKGLTFLQLWVDKIVIHDDRGNNLYMDPQVTQRIATQVSTYQDTTNNNVLAWFGANEPASIDNYLCFRKVRDIIKVVNPGLDLYTTFTAGWLGKYGGPWFISGACDTSISPGTEFARKSGIGFVSINLYNYQYPYPYDSSISSAFIENNIHYVYYKYLRKLVRDNVMLQLKQEFTK